MQCVCFFFQAEDGIRDLVRSRGLGDVYKRQELALLLVQDAFRISAQSQEVELGVLGDGQEGGHELSLIHI